jgi:acyl carrier protein
MPEPMEGERATDVESIRAFVLEHGDWHGTADELGDEVPLLDNVLDSIGIAGLVVMLERKLGIEVRDGDLDAVNFATIAAVAALVERRRADG